MAGDEAVGDREWLSGSASVLVSLPAVVSWPQFVHPSLTAPVLTLVLGRDRCHLFTIWNYALPPWYFYSCLVFFFFLVEEVMPLK